MDNRFCASAGGPTICVRFDNLPITPEQGIDFVFSFSGTTPSVVVLRGRNPQGILYDWRVWSTGAIGSITAPGEYDYSVKIRNPNGSIGADSVGSLVLQPTGDHYSSIAAGSFIGLSLSGDLVVQQNAQGGGGEVDLHVNRFVYGDITIPTVRSLIVEVAFGAITIGQIALPSREPGAFVDIRYGVFTTLQVGVLQGSLLVRQGLSGDVFITDRIEDGSVLIRRTVEPGALIAIADMVGAVTVRTDLGDFGGILLLSNGVPAAATVELFSRMTPGSSLDLNGQATAGRLTGLHGEGTVVNGGPVTGRAEFGSGPDSVFSGTATFASVATQGTVATNPADEFPGDVPTDFAGVLNIVGSMDGNTTVSGKLLSPGRVLVNGDIAGSVVVADSEGVSDGQIVANADGAGGGAITGPVTITHTFDGNLCGDNLSQTEPLPPNFMIASFGPNWTICGQAG